MHYAVEVAVESHLNEILSEGGGFQTCQDKTIQKAMETSFTIPLEHTPRSTFLETQKGHEGMGRTTSSNA